LATQPKESEIAMNKKLAQIVSLANKIDYRHLQLASFFLILAVAVITRSPADGGGGPT
jgi:hypothetical protein